MDFKTKKQKRNCKQTATEARFRILYVVFTMLGVLKAGQKSWKQ